MPFTPFHMGPGLVLKAIGGRHFSVLVFGIAQVAMDIEPLLGLLRGAPVLHGWTHTLLGATLIGVPVALLGPFVCNPILRAWNAELQTQGAVWLASPPSITRLAALSGAFIGTWSHVLLDGVMHADLHPFAPWSQLQPWRGLIGIGELHGACIVSAVAGVLCWLAVAGWRRRRARQR
jgi:membrane-bound metal-dependent hydrolase YbcI (DUF457 family)